MAHTSSGVDSVVEELVRLEVRSGLAVHEVLQQELRCLNMLICCLTKCNESGEDIDLANATARFRVILTEAGLLTVVNESKGEEEVGSLAPNLLKNFEQFESEIREICVVLLDSLKSMPCSANDIRELIDCLVGNMKDLANLKADIVVSLKNQITVLAENLSLQRMIVDFAVERWTFKDRDDLLEKWMYIRDCVMNWVQDVATFSLVCLLERKDETWHKDWKTMLSDLLQKIKPRTLEVMQKFIEFLKATEPSASNKSLVSQIAVKLVDFLLEGLIDPLKDYVAILREGLIFMITFFMDPEEETITDGEDGLFTRINTVLDEVLSFIISMYMNKKLDFSLGKKVVLSSLLDGIDKAKVEIQELYVQVPNLSNFNYPATNVVGFIDFVLGNLREMVKGNANGIGFAKEPVMIIQEKLLSFKPFLEDIMQSDLKDVENQIINLVFLAEHVISSCLVMEHPIWYDLLQLSNVTQAIELVESEVKKFSDQISNARMTSTDTVSSHVPRKQANPSTLQDDVVGMKDESMTIIDKLTRGKPQLEIISIVGMPGLGKTTLAKKVYNDPRVKYYFQRCAWYCVSQVYNLREMFFHILRYVDAQKSFSESSDNDLAENLWKCLKGRKYLIVLDDIWSIEAWNDIRASFPDDKNGSRIIFTSRIHNLVSQDKLNCCPHFLRPLLNEESWELFQKKLFNTDSSPSDDICKIGKKIVKNCRGLPLAVVLVAGILAGKKIEFWKQIEESTSSKVVSEGCMDVLELSYKHLPDYLKPCFLYFGAFPQDRVVRSRKLLNIWIAEGLVPRISDKKSIYQVAENYLSDLINRSLVILEETTSNGGIKACRVHDLIYDLCLVKIQQDNFLQRMQETDILEASLNLKRYDSYRLCIDPELIKFVDTESASPFVRSLISVYQDSLKGLVYLPCLPSFFNNFKLLNVLDLVRILIQSSFPEELTLMVHLRYLSINHTHGGGIPDSIVNLWHLETLIINSGTVYLPRTFWKMKSLRHVAIDSIGLQGIEHHESGQLQDLDVFSHPNLDSEEETNELWRRLPGLRKLKCVIREKHFIYEPSKFPELSRLTDLQVLKVRIFWENIQQFPNFDLPSSLRILKLDGGALSGTAISIIGQLPNLEVLKLRDLAFAGEKWDTEEGEFLKLKMLELRNVKIQQWNVADEEPFPSLERLVVKWCFDLEGIPSSLGYIRALKRIEVVGSSYAVSRSAKAILREQQDDYLEVLHL